MDRRSTREDTREPPSSTLRSHPRAPRSYLRAHQLEEPLESTPRRAQKARSLTHLRTTSVSRTTVSAMTWSVWAPLHITGSIESIPTRMNM